MSASDQVHPAGWERRSGRELFEYVTSGSRGWAKYYTEDGPTFLRIGNLDRGTISLDLRDIQRVRPPVGAEGTRTRVAPGDVLVSITADIGSVAVVPDGLGDAYINQHIALIRPKPGINARYLAWFIVSPDGQRQLAALERGATKKGLGLDDIRALDIPWAPEQIRGRIVEEIEKQLTRLDSGVEALKSLQAHLRRYRRALAQEAVSGGPAPGHDWIDEQSGPSGLRLPRLPAGWQWKTVRDVGATAEQTVLTGPFGTGLGASDFVDAGVPVLTIGCLTEQTISLEKALFVTPSKATTLERYRLRAGDLLFSRMASVGRAGYVTGALEGALINYHIMRLRLDSATLHPGFFLAYVRASQVVADYLRQVNHGATRPGINTEQLLAMPVPVPPISIQKARMDGLEASLAAMHHLERGIFAGIQRASGLRTSLLRSAFEGRLTPVAVQHRHA